MVIILSIIFVLLYSILNGWAFSVVWEMFMVPIFHVPALSIAQALGVGIILNWYSTAAHINTNDSKELLSNALNVLLKPIIAVVFGYVLLQFM